ncbi:unnamed protein product [Brassica napus]|uniref:(rape) hypothetical protein n=1 Tax=Brassica napus TaxID=3708 RepID=A0A816KMA2_BRANA|nr:unnamed protein product [Brassica napus]
MLQTHGSTSQSRIPMGLLLTSQIHLHLSLAVFLGSPWCQHLVQVSSSSPSLLSTLHLKPTFLLGGNLALRMEAAGFLAIGPLDLLFSGDSPYRLSPPPFTSTHKPSPPPSPSVLVLKHLLHLRESDSFCHATPPHVSSTPVDRRSPAFLLSPNQNRSFTWRYIELDNPTYRRRCSVHFELSHKVMRLGLVDPTVLDDLLVSPKVSPPMLLWGMLIFLINFLKISSGFIGIFTETYLHTMCHLSFMKKLQPFHSPVDSPGLSSL